MVEGKQKKEVETNFRLPADFFEKLSSEGEAIGKFESGVMPKVGTKLGIIGKGSVEIQSIDDDGNVVFKIIRN